MTSWQGGGSVIDPLKRVGEGVSGRPSRFRWRANGKRRCGCSAGPKCSASRSSCPRTRDLPVKEIPASRQFTRPFVYDKQNLQREQKKDVPAILTTLGYLAVVALALGLLGLIVWGLMRVDRSYRDPSSGPPSERARRPATTTTGRVAPAR